MDKKVTAFTELTAVAGTDMVPIIDDPSGSAKAKKITVDNLNTEYPKAVNYQENTSDTSVSDQLIQTGWGWKLWDGATQTQSEGVTFAVAYDARPVVIISSLGYKHTDPTHIGDFTADGDNAFACTMQASAIATTGFTAGFQIHQEVTPNNATRNGYSWMAIGTKAR